MHINTITSRANPAVLDAVKLKDRKYRGETGRFYFEGVKLLSEAAAAGVGLCGVFVTGELYAELRRDARYGGIFSGGGSEPEDKPSEDKPGRPAVYIVSDSVYEKLSDEKSPQGVLCVAKSIDKFHKYNKIYNKALPGGGLLALSSVRDPGNVGAAIRSAAAFGISELILSADCADIYNPKAIRASMGAVFRMPTAVCSDFAASLDYIAASGFHVLAAMPDRDAKPVLDYDFGRGVCFVIGNEGRGLDREVLGACTGSVFIPMTAAAESLNASAAAAVLMWEYFRRR